MNNKEILSFIKDNDVLNNVVHGATINGVVNGKFNPMAISWLTIGQIWNKIVVNVYVREHRFTYEGIQEEFTISLSPEVNKEVIQITGTKSGRDIDKVEKLGLNLVDSKVITTQGYKEMPITLECKVIHKQDFDFNQIKENEKMLSFYSDADANGMIGGRKDKHTIFTAEVVNAYVAK